MPNTYARAYVTILITEELPLNKKFHYSTETYLCSGSDSSEIRSEALSRARADYPNAKKFEVSGYQKA